MFENDKTLKIIHPFDQKVYPRVNRFYPVFLEIVLRQENDGNHHLSFHGVQAPLPSGNARGGCGQIDMEYYHLDESQNDKRYTNLVKADELRFAEGWNAEMWYKFLDIWHKHHLVSFKEFPQDVMDFIASLPKTDRTPNWV